MCCKDVDCDEILSYETVKIVLIHDRKLGILHYGLMLVIVAYVIGYSVVYEKRYVTIQQPIGSVRLSLLAPQKRSQPHSLPYCLTNNTSTLNSTVPKNMTYPCVYFDEKLVLLPNPIQESSIFISTRITTTNQTLNQSCSLFDPKCFYVDGDVQNLYIADIENFTIMIDHTISDTYNVGNVLDLTGTLYDTQHNPINVNYPDQFGKKGVFDILQVGTLLRAAGINSLDELSTNREYLTKRYEGLVVLLQIDYTNMFSFDLRNTQYFVTATVIPKAYFKVEQPLFASDTSLVSRIIWNRHGVRMIVLQSGTLGRFDFPTMLISFVAGLGLVAVSTLIVDILATKILPRREVYKKFKYLSTSESGHNPLVTQPNEGENNGENVNESLGYGSFKN